MKLLVYDAGGNQVYIVTQGQETPVDKSGVCTGSAQEAAAANDERSGFFIQNPISNNFSIFVNDLGEDATDDQGDITGHGSIVLAPGASYSSVGNYVTVEAISVFGPDGQKFIMEGMVTMGKQLHVHVHRGTGDSFSLSQVKAQEQKCDAACKALESAIGQLGGNASYRSAEQDTNQTNSIIQAAQKLKSEYSRLADMASDINRG